MSDDPRDELLALARALGRATRRRAHLGVPRVPVEPPAGGWAPTEPAAPSEPTAARTEEPAGAPAEAGPPANASTPTPTPAPAPAPLSTPTEPEPGPSRDETPAPPERPAPPEAPRSEEPRFSVSTSAEPAMDRFSMEEASAGVPRPETHAADPAPEAPAARTPAPEAPTPSAPPALPPAPPEDRPLTGDEVHERAEAVRAVAAACGDLASLAEAVAGCTACGLCRTRRNTVFADGTGRAGVLFVGEAPGAHEDASGVPFVGDAGELLTRIITQGMGLAREDVLIANVLKCRPPGNRDPSPAEKAICTPWLDRQVELAGLRVLVPLGRHAAQHLLDAPGASMGSLRGKVHARGERRIVPTYHPAYLNRSPQDKSKCWQDIQLAMAELGLERPRQKPRPSAGASPGNAPGGPPAGPSRSTPGRPSDPGGPGPGSPPEAGNPDPPGR